MDLIKLSNFISDFSPLLASAIKMESPVSNILTSLIYSVFGLDKKVHDIDTLKNKISQDELAYMRLKQIEFEHHDLLFSKEIDDRKSARDREKEIVKATGKRDWLLECIAFIVIFGYFLMCVLILFNKIDHQNNQVLYMMFGQLTGGFIMVLSYYFGSSKTQNQ